MYAPQTCTQPRALMHAPLPLVTYQLSSYLALNQVPTGAQLSHVNGL